MIALKSHDSDPARVVIKTDLRPVDLHYFHSCVTQLIADIHESRQEFTPEARQGISFIMQLMKATLPSEEDYERLYGED